MKFSISTTSEGHRDVQKVDIPSSGAWKRSYYRCFRRADPATRSSRTRGGKRLAQEVWAAQFFDEIPLDHAPHPLSGGAPARSSSRAP